MLKKVNRLAKAKDIQKAFARGRTFFSPIFNIKFLSHAPTPRFTVVVSTKVFKRAHDRNRLKRIIREYLRKNLQKFKNGSYIIMAKPKVSTISEAEAMKSFLQVCSKIQ